MSVLNESARHGDSVWFGPLTAQWQMLCLSCLCFLRPSLKGLFKAKETPLGKAGIGLYSLYLRNNLNTTATQAASIPEPDLILCLLTSIQGRPMVIFWKLALTLGEPWMHALCRSCTFPPTQQRTKETRWGGASGHCQKKRTKGFGLWIGGWRSSRPSTGHSTFLLVFCIGIKGKDGAYPLASKKGKARGFSSPRAVLPHSAERKLK